MHVLCPGSPSRVLYQSSRINRGPILTHDGEIAVVSSSERSGTMDFSLLAFDVQSGALPGELWDGDGASVAFGPPSPVPGDLRVLATTSRSGYDRPLIWNPRTGDRRSLALDGIPGTVTPMVWSPDAGKVLLCQVFQARFQRSQEVGCSPVIESSATGTRGTLTMPDSPPPRKPRGPISFS